MKNEPIYLKVDSRNRVSLTKLSKQLSDHYIAYSQDNKIILEPVTLVPENEAWLFKPENKEILNSVKRGLKQKATVKRGSFSKYLK